MREGEDIQQRSLGWDLNLRRPCRGPRPLNVGSVYCFTNATPRNVYVCGHIIILLVLQCP